MDLDKFLIFPNIIKILITGFMGLCIISMLTFVITYAQVYEFLPYSVFSLSGLLISGLVGWVWVIAFILFFGAFIFFACAICIKSDKFSRKDFVICSSYFLLIPIILAFFLYNDEIHKKVIYFLVFYYFLIGFFVSSITSLFIDIYKKKQKIGIYIAGLFAIIVYFACVVATPILFAKTFEVIFLKLGLAAKNVQIEFKDEKKCVKGILRFKDDKYAYVEYGHIQCGSAEPKDKSEAQNYPFKTQVPPENVKIKKPSLPLQSQPAEL